jgi:protein-S-isoprenylcysteine O-methyltransferase Ste14
LKGTGNPLRARTLPPPLYFAAAFLAGVALDRWLTLPLAPPPLIEGPAFILIALSGLLAGSAFYLFFTARTPVRPGLPPTAFVASGPYRFTRNPMYLSLILLHIGLSLLLSFLWPLLLLPFAVWLVQVRVVQKEELQLRIHFGQDYARYCERVRRWI